MQPWCAVAWPRSTYQRLDVGLQLLAALFNVHALLFCVLHVPVTRPVAYMSARTTNMAVARARCEGSWRPLPQQPLPQEVDRIIGLRREGCGSPTGERIAHELLQVLGFIAHWHGCLSRVPQCTSQAVSNDGWPFGLPLRSFASSGRCAGNSGCWRASRNGRNKETINDIMFN